MTQRKQAAVKLKDRRWIFEFAGHVLRRVAQRNGQPRRAACEARIGIVVPLHGRAFAVPSFLLGPAAAADRIFDIVFANGSLFSMPISSP